MGNRKIRNTDKRTGGSAIRRMWCSVCDTVFYTYIDDRSNIRCPICRASVYSEGENVE